MIRFILAAFLSGAGIVGSLAQTGVPSGGAPYVQTSVLFATGVSSWTVPPNVTYANFSGCAPGGPGGGGQASAGTAGGGGGGAGSCLRNFGVPLTPGATLTITIPAAPAGPAAGSGGSIAGNLTVAGLPSGWGTLTLYGGCPGVAGAAGAGGASGGGAGQCQALGFGQGPAAAGVSGSNAFPANDPFWEGLAGGGGGNTAGAAGSGGVYASATIIPNMYGIIKGAGGSGNGAGGGGAGTIFGTPVNGTASGISCPSSPTFVGFGQGGCGGGSNGSGGPGGPGFLMITY